MVYGTRQLNKFNNNIVNEFGKPCHYFEMEKKNGEVCSRVHDAVCEMMDRLAQSAECRAGKTALGDLLEVVRTRLLVVRLGPPTSRKGKAQQLDANTQVRADAATLKAKLEDIIRRGERDSSYWLEGTGDDHVQSQYTKPAVEPQHDAPLCPAQKGSSGNVAEVFMTDSSSVASFTLTGSSIVCGAQKSQSMYLSK